MRLAIIGVTALACLASAPCFAQSWTGYLVDSRCYDAEQRNVNPFTMSPELLRDHNLEIEVCTASSKTKSFAVVEPNRLTPLKLDPSGNERAVAFVRKFGKKSFRQVTITGEQHDDTVIANSILDTTRK